MASPDPAAPSSKKGLSPLIAITLTVFIDMLSFGMAIPDLQLRADSLGAKGALMGILLASYSITQFLFAPLLGRWSDIKGRRPVLLITSALTVVCFLIYSQAHTLELMFISRILAGMSAANIGVAFAYIADTTKPEERSKGMGLVGAAFGLGFIFGPVFGAELVSAAGGQPNLLGFVAAGLGVVNLFFIWFALPEPPVIRAKASASIKQSFTQLGVALQTPGLGLLIVLYFVANFAFSNLESTFFRLLEFRWEMNQSEGARVLFAVGVAAAFTQGYWIGKLTKRFGELLLVRVGYLGQVPALLAVPYSPPWFWMIAGASLLGILTGVSNPSINSLISRSAPPDMQGGTIGVVQSAGALARIFGPIVGSMLFDRVNYASPYWLASALMLFPALALLRYRPKFHESNEASGYSPAH